MIKIKKRILILCMLPALLLSGCFDYSDMNKLFFTTMGIWDNDGQGNVHHYLECFKAYRGEGEKAGSERRVVVEGEAKTAYQAYMEMTKSTSFPLEYSQNKAMIFTARAAEIGLKEMIDGPSRNQKFNPRQYVFLYCGEPQELLEVEMEDEQFIGLFLDNMMLNLGKSANIAQLRFDDLKYRRLIGSRVYVMPMIEKKQEALAERIKVSGAAVIQDDVLAGELGESEVVAYNFLSGGVKTGVLLATQPGYDDRYITLEILKSTVKQSLSFDGERIHAKKIVTVKVAVEGVGDSIDLENDETRRQIEQGTEEKLQQDCLSLFETYRDRGVDILNVALDFERKYPRAGLEDMLEKTDLTVEFRIRVQGSQNVTNFQ